MAAGPDTEQPGRAPKLPFAISRLSSKRAKYMLYDIDTVTWLRREHHILGVQIGGMPQFPQQNLFFGLPLELMPEEACLLVEKGLAYIVDDFEMHNKIFRGIRKGNGRAIKAAQQYQQEIADIADRSETEWARARAEGAERIRGTLPQTDHTAAFWNGARLPWIGCDPSNTTIIDQSNEQTQQLPTRGEPWTVTPTTASSLLQLAEPSSTSKVDATPSTYVVYKHLHEKGYFMSPGLRFGCQLMAYPGDPLRYHSHFLARGVEWDEELDLMDIVGGGRLGTGVKKGYLLGGVEEGSQNAGQVRTFCIEWGGL